MSARRWTPAQDLAFQVDGCRRMARIHGSRKVRRWMMSRGRVSRLILEAWQASDERARAETAFRRLVERYAAA